MRSVLALCGVGALIAACHAPLVPAGTSQARVPARPVQSSAANAAIFDGEGYRRARYRAPVDRDPMPARTMSQDKALRLDPERDALFIDVLPVDGGWRDPDSGVWRLAHPHQTIPGAIWHPETGRADPDPVLWQGLVEEIALVRQARPGLPVVVFCRSDCWMGWNAARRLAKNGFRDIFWYPDGIEGWREAGHDLIEASPQAVH